MSDAARPLPSLPKTDGSLDVGQASSPSSSTPSIPSLFEDCVHPSNERSLRSSVSLPIVPPTANVQFAPLPEIDPRDRRSTRPLGMAARSQMLQQRRNARMQDVQRQARVWAEPDDRPMICVPDEEQEDPLEAFLRFIADKSKSLWKRVTSKAKQSDNTGATTMVEGERDAVQSRLLNREGVPSTSDHPNHARGISKN